MLKNKFYIFLAILISFLLLGSCFDEEIEASFGQELVLSIGQTAVFENKDLKIKFVSVTSDSRCPKGVTCVWAGEAKCQILIGNDRSFSGFDLVETGGTTDYTQIYYQNGDNSIKLVFKLDPYPEKNKQIDISDYILMLTVTPID
jgi:hypothetical protein